MPKIRNISSAFIITAATIGSGVFTLPYVIAQAGWLLTLLYYVLLGIIVVATHAVYLKTLATENEKIRLLGLGEKYFGAAGFWFGFIGIVIGLLLSFVIFLILGTQFIQLIFPSISHEIALFIFWIILAGLTLISNRRAASLELLSVSAVTAIILFIFASGTPGTAFNAVPAISWQNIFLPFGIVLFTLAGWTGVEPFYEASRNPEAGKHHLNANTVIALSLGTGFAILLYWMFSAGILSSAPSITPNITTSLANWPIWKKDIIAAVGLFIIGTVAIPISHELRNALEKDLEWNVLFAKLVIIVLPVAIVLLGFNNFLAAAGLAGGVFIGMEYLLIIAVGRRALKFSTIQKFGLDLISLIFAVAAIYEVWFFIVK